MELAAASGGGVVLLLEIPTKDPSFDFTKAVCSHGLFMMAPNHWDPASSTLERPLRLPTGSVRAHISHPKPPGSIVVSVSSAAPLSSDDEQALLDQVRRMLRISDYNDRIIQEFHRIHADSRERGFGRVFRSPTLFEDMVKCILLCNCQWPRTLTMAKALCELHLQVKHGCNPEGFHSKTSHKIKQKRKRKKVDSKLETIITCNGTGLLETPDSVINHNTQPTDTQGYHSLNPSQFFNDTLKHSDGSPSSFETIGHFPTPEELAILDATFLAKRCKLGYRSQHIISLAQSIVNGNVQLRKLEELCEGYSPLNYESIDEQLSALGGFGPFSGANVLMCMGFYHRIPADKETFRHIRQKNIEAIYGKYAPFQFLAYWSELWKYYEERFGTWSKMPASSYKLARHVI